MRKCTYWKHLGGYSFGILILAIAAIIVSQTNAGQMFKAKPKPSQNTEVISQAKPPEAKPEIIFGGREVSIGSKHAPLTIVMYYSLTCPHCHEYQQDELPKIQKEYIDKGLVRFVYRDFPTDASAINAAKIAWCHGTTQYLNFAKKLLQTQDKWVPLDLAKIKESEAEFHKIATTDLGISERDFHKCFHDANLEASILRQSFEAQKVYEINAAPAFLINDKYFNGIVTTDTIREKLAELGIRYLPS